MKNLLTFILFLCFTGANAQLIPNNGFEEWDIVPYDEPLGYWITSNYFSAPAYGKAGVLKVTGYKGAHAIRLQTMVSGMDTIPVGMEQYAIPSTVVPAAINGFYRYNLPAKDSATIAIIFQKNGSVYDANVFKIKGTGSQSTFTSFSFPLTTSSVPDTIIIVAASGNLDVTNGYPTWPGRQPGSWIELDSLYFTGTGVPAIPNGNFENWKAMSYETPKDWLNGESDGTEPFYNIEGNVRRTRDRHSGEYAAQLMTIKDMLNPFGGTTSASLSLISQLPVNTTDTLVLTGYYKYASPGKDTGAVSIIYYDAGGMVMNSGQAGQLPPAASYTPFSVIIIPQYIPSGAASMGIIIKSSRALNGGSSGGIIPIIPVEGSTLFIDDLEFKAFDGNMTGVAHTGVNNKITMVYPNPVTDVVNIRLENIARTGMNVVLTDSKGGIVYKGIHSGAAAIALPVNVLPQGLYFYHIQSGDFSDKGSFIKR